MDYLYIFFAVAIFIAVVLLIEGIYVTWNTSRGPDAKRIARRLQVMSAGSHARQADVSILKKRLLSESPGIQRLLLQVPRIHRLDRLLEQSGTKLNVAQFCLLSLGCGAATLALLSLTQVPALVTLALSIAALCIPWLSLIGKKRKRLAKIEGQLPDALDLMSRAMRAGHALPSAIKMVSEEMPEPLADEFRIVFDEVNYGISMQEALKNMAARVPGTDVGYFVVAVLIQRETGGNLTELLHNIATIVRERLKLFGQIKVFSAEGRLSAWILGLMPFGMAAVLQLVNPGFMSLLWSDPAGQQMLGCMAVLMVLGVFWMRKLIRIRM
ncbi:type II secretion system F family protein [Undibacterium sp.]|jgi:tight adherence protein B|uniref:type II secretion system F family protein n=1 Tax=Undibacterium sp. TaxID=1914977 RepID=UPI002B5EA58A|nr:type II secretion system F family protein [Undibacterium sp.]HTD04527.1 type II secretion system F family protein [Undibacterium sp.]